MTFRISFKSLLFLTLLGFYGPVRTWAKISGKPEWVDKYQSTEFQFTEAGTLWSNVTAGRHPRWVHKILNEWVAWDPQDPLVILSSGCSASDLQLKLKNALTTEQHNEIFQKYSLRCGAEFIKPFGSAYLGPLGMFAMKYSLDQNPFLRRVVIHLPNGQKLKAALALKDEKPRPFVVLRMGITGNVEEAFAERFFYYHMFERGFFHLLLVENMTSTDFIANNKTTSLGGIAEGHQNIWLARTLRNPDHRLSGLIESLHFVGLSLGGQGVLTAAWLQPAQKNHRAIQSFLGLCPLVNLKSTFEQLFQQSYLKYPLEFWARSRFQEVRKFKPEIFEGPFGLPEKILELNKKEFKSQAEVFGVQEPEFIERSKDYYFLHNLSAWDPTLRDPIRVWLTSKDDIVAAGINSLQLPESYPLVIPQGQHCSFPVEWHPHVTQALFNAHILRNSNLAFRTQSLVLETLQQRDWVLESVQGTQKKEILLIFRSPSSMKGLQLVALRDQVDFQLDHFPLGNFEVSVLKKWFSTNLKIHYEVDEKKMIVSWPVVRSDK